MLTNRSHAAVLATAVALVAALSAGCASRGVVVGPDRDPGVIEPVATQSPAQADPDVFELIEVRVTRVVDGDTVRVRMPDSTIEKVRFIGVNTPESTIRHEPYGKEASAYTKRCLQGRAVFLETDAGARDRYGRLLAYVWLARPTERSAAEIRDKMFNARLLIDGYAQIMTVPPNVAYVDFFIPLQAEARDANRGLWALPVP